MNNEKLIIIRYTGSELTDTGAITVLKDIVESCTRGDVTKIHTLSTEEAQDLLKILNRDNSENIVEQAILYVEKELKYTLDEIYGIKSNKMIYTIKSNKIIIPSCLVKAIYKKLLDDENFSKALNIIFDNYLSCSELCKKHKISKTTINIMKDIYGTYQSFINAFS